MPSVTPHRIKELIKIADTQKWKIYNFLLMYLTIFNQVSAILIGYDSAGLLAGPKWSLTIQNKHRRMTTFPNLQNNLNFRDKIVLRKLAIVIFF